MNVHTQFFRRRDDYMIAGVASGIARALGVDAWIIRLIFLILVIGFGTGLLAYFVLWMIMPIEPNGVVIHPYQFADEDINKNRSWVGVVLMLVGVYLLVSLLFGPQIWRFAIPVLLIVGGIFLFGRKK
jgi:phage shock protein PspC (stress-responsive transcriptional regulator)